MSFFVFFMLIIFLGTCNYPSKNATISGTVYPPGSETDWVQFLCPEIPKDIAFQLNAHYSDLSPNHLQMIYDYIAQSPENLERMIFVGTKTTSQQASNRSAQALMRYACDRSDWDLVNRLLLIQSDFAKSNPGWGGFEYEAKNILSTTFSEEKSGLQNLKLYLQHLSQQPQHEQRLHDSLNNMVQNYISKDQMDKVSDLVQTFPTFDIEKHLMQRGHLYDAYRFEKLINHFQLSQEQLNQFFNHLMTTCLEKKDGQRADFNFESWILDNFLGNKNHALNWYQTSNIPEQQRKKVLKYCMDIYQESGLKLACRYDTTLLLKIIEKNLTSDIFETNQLQLITDIYDDIDTSNQRLSVRECDILLKGHLPDELWSSQHTNPNPATPKEKAFHSQLTEWYQNLMEPEKKSFVQWMLVQNQNEIETVIKILHPQHPELVIQHIPHEKASSCLRSISNRKYLPMYLDIHSNNQAICHEIAAAELSDKTYQQKNVIDKLITDAKVTTQQKIDTADDLSPDQKAILTKAIQEMYTWKLITHTADRCALDPTLTTIAPQLLEKYFPLAIYVAMAQGKNIYDTSQSHTSRIVKNCFQANQNLMPIFAFNEVAQIHNQVDQQNIDRVHPDYQQDLFLRDLVVTGMLQKIVTLEQECEQSETQPFFHGRNWSWNFANDMWNIQQEIIARKNNPWTTLLQDTLSTIQDIAGWKKKQPKISLRYRPQDVNISKLYEYREKLLTQGAEMTHGTGTKSYGHSGETTCLNQSVVSNKQYYGECTGRYFSRNRSMSSDNAAHNAVDTMFPWKDYDSDVSALQMRIKGLASIHQATNDRGEILCLKVKKPYVDSLVYPAIVCGQKFKSQATTTELLQQCDNDSQESNQFTGTKEPRNFYCFAVSDIPGEYGKKYTIDSLHCADSNAYADYMQEREQLRQDLIQHFCPPIQIPTIDNTWNMPELEESLG